MHGSNHVVVPEQFFFCLVGRLACYQVEKKQKIIPGVLGSTWGHNFYTGTHNGLKLEI
jgi:hypothetical protein